MTYFTTAVHMLTVFWMQPTSHTYKNIEISLLMRDTFFQIKFLGIQPSITISAGQPLYLFLSSLEWFICFKVITIFIIIINAWLIIYKLSLLKIISVCLPVIQISTYGLIENKYNKVTDVITNLILKWYF